MKYAVVEPKYMPKKTFILPIINIRDYNGKHSLTEVFFAYISTNLEESPNFNAKYCTKFNGVPGLFKVFILKVTAVEAIAYCLRLNSTISYLDSILEAVSFQQKRVTSVPKKFREPANTDAELNAESAKRRKKENMVKKAAQNNAKMQNMAYMGDILNVVTFCEQSETVNESKAPEVPISAANVPISTPYISVPGVPVSVPIDPISATDVQTPKFHVAAPSLDDLNLGQNLSYYEANGNEIFGFNENGELYLISSTQNDGLQCPTSDNTFETISNEESYTDVDMNVPVLPIGVLSDVAVSLSNVDGNLGENILESCGGLNSINIDNSSTHPLPKNSISFKKGKKGKNAKSLLESTVQENHPTMLASTIVSNSNNSYQSAMNDPIKDTSQESPQVALPTKALALSSPNDLQNLQMSNKATGKMSTSTLKQNSIVPSKVNTKSKTGSASKKDKNGQAILIPTVQGKQPTPMSSSSSAITIHKTDKSDVQRQQATNDAEESTGEKKYKEAYFELSKEYENLDERNLALQNALVAANKANNVPQVVFIEKDDGRFYADYDVFLDQKQCTFLDKIEDHQKYVNSLALAVFSRNILCISSVTGAASKNFKYAPKDALDPLKLKLIYDLMAARTKNNQAFNSTAINKIIGKKIANIVGAEKTKARNQALKH